MARCSIDLGLPWMRQYWQACNRADREAEALLRAQRKARDKKRKKCRCEAYPWPHRPGGGLCRWPEPPLERYQRKPGSRPYRKRYLGLLRQIARASGLHPIKDRAAILERMPRMLALAKHLHEQQPMHKYRNMEITPTGLRAHWTRAGPEM